MTPPPTPTENQLLAAKIAREQATTRLLNGLWDLIADVRAALAKELAGRG